LAREPWTTRLAAGDLWATLGCHAWSGYLRRRRDEDHRLLIVAASHPTYARVDERVEDACMRARGPHNWPILYYSSTSIRAGLSLSCLFVYGLYLALVAMCAYPAQPSPVCQCEHEGHACMPLARCHLSASLSFSIVESVHAEKMTMRLRKYEACS
jgi:hypothetical protein